MIEIKCDAHDIGTSCEFTRERTLLIDISMMGAQHKEAKLTIELLGYEPLVRLRQIANQLDQWATFLENNTRSPK